MQITPTHPYRPWKSRGFLTRLPALVGTSTGPASGGVAVLLLLLVFCFGFGLLPRPVLAVVGVLALDFIASTPLLRGVMLSTDQLEYLSYAARKDGPRWAYTTEDRARIDLLVRLGLLEPAPGECVYEAPTKLEHVQAFGHTVPMRGKLLSLYRLTALGSRALASCGAERHRAANDRLPAPAREGTS